MPEDTYDYFNDYYSQFESIQEDSLFNQIPVDWNEWAQVDDETLIQSYLPKKGIKQVTIGIDHPLTTPIELFESIPLSKAIQYRKGCIIHTGGAIWGLDFVPMKKKSRFYITVGGYTDNKKHYTPTDQSTSPNCIQIYKYDVLDDTTSLYMCILHDQGDIFDLKWCPYFLSNKHKDVLGILGVLSADGQIRFMVVPHPHELRKLNSRKPVYLKVVHYRLELNINNTHFTCFEWGGQNRLACGHVSGNVILFNIYESLIRKHPYAIQVFPVQTGYVTDLTWQNMINPYQLIVATNAGIFYLYDLKDPYSPKEYHKTSSSQASFAPGGIDEGFLYSLGDGDVKIGYGLSKRNAFSNIINQPGHIWSIASCVYHNVVASVASTGSLVIRKYTKEGPSYGSRMKDDSAIIYLLQYNPDTHGMTFYDKPKAFPRYDEFQSRFMNPLLSLNRVKWNQHPLNCGWVCSGGNAGLCRIDFTGCMKLP
ncbi:hypothetical protein BDB01DRAFT_851955 [Pilobolus umbonatus]|nr:hypothetical protein BDB01DRAFT_851955 [Pilobolus umbonatus]